MKINVHAGHNPDGKKACGAVGLIKESTEARAVKDEVVDLLRQLGHTVYDCTCNNGTSQADVLTKIVKLCNDHEVDLDVSIHFNANAKDKTGNGKTTGTEVLIYSKNGGAYAFAENIAKSIAGLGYRNRGVKIRTDLYFLSKTKAPALLVECCFVDDKDDVNLYEPKSMAKAIVDGIIGKASPAKEFIENKKEANSLESTTESFRVKIKVNSLNIRSGPGTEYSINGVIKDKGVYTIIKKIGNWGLLKSKQGYINISKTYATKIE